MDYIKKIFFTVFFLFSFCLGLQAHSVEASTVEQEEIPISFPLENDFSLFPEIEMNLIKMKSLVDSGNLQGIGEVIKQVAYLRARLESDNLPFVSGFFRTIGDNLISKGRKDTGIFILEKSSEAFPGDYKIYFNLSRVYFSSGNFSPLKGYLNLKRGVKEFVNLETREKWLFSLIVVIVTLTSLLTVYIYLLFLFVKVFRRLHFDLKRFFFGKLNFDYSGYVASVMIFIPLLLGGFYFFLLSISVYSWNYITGFRAKALLIMVSLYLFWFPFIFKSGLEGIFTKSSQLTQEAEKFSNHTWDFNTLTTFKKKSLHDKNNLFINLAIGLMYKRMGENREAYILLKELVEKYPKNISALINYGNINLILGDNQSALSLYQRAINIEPASAEAYYNMSLALNSLIKLEEADKAFKRAYELDPKKIQNFLNLKTIDRSEPLDEISSANFSDKKDIYQNLSIKDYRLFLKFFLVPEEMYALMPLFIYIIIVSGICIIYINFPMKLSDICDECGSIINRNAGCTLCISLFLPHNMVDMEKREKGMVKVWKNSINKKIIPIGLNLIFPGGAYVYENRDIFGFLMIFLSASMIEGICMSSSLFREEPLPYYQGTLIFIYAIFYFVSNLTFFLKRL